MCTAPSQKHEFFEPHLCESVWRWGTNFADLISLNLEFYSPYWWFVKASWRRLHSLNAKWIHQIWIISITSHDLKLFRNSWIFRSIGSSICLRSVSAVPFFYWIVLKCKFFYVSMLVCIIGVNTNMTFSVRHVFGHRGFRLWILFMFWTVCCWYFSPQKLSKLALLNAK